jgi:ferritin-like metal-binding protein YciE
MSESAQEHLLHHLRDVHALELHASRQLERAARRRDEQTASVYQEHLEQSREHEQRIQELVEAHGHSPSPLEDKTLRGRSIGLRQLADIPLDTPVKLVMNLFALNHLQIAAHELLLEIARAAENEDAAQTAEQILEQERAAAEQVEDTFDRAVELLVNEESEEDLLLAHLRDVHALELQSAQLLHLAVDELSEDEQLSGPYTEHLEQTERHEKLIAERLESREAKPSAVKDLHFSAAKSGLHDLSADPPDARVKMAMNLFCVEHLEIAGYEVLKRLAEHEGDNETAEAAQKIAEEERQAAEKIRDGFARAVELMLQSERSYEGVRAAERTEQTDDGEAGPSPEQVTGQAAEAEPREAPASA